MSMICPSHRHFLQLFHHLRLTENRAKRTGWTQDLGHFDHLLGDGGVEERPPGEESSGPWRSFMSNSSSLALAVL